MDASVVGVKGPPAVAGGEMRATPFVKDFMAGPEKRNNDGS
jgi:hypothetical protein